MPDCRSAAAKLGIEIPDAAGIKFRGIRFHGAGRSVEADFPAGHGLGVRRTALHELLVKTAERAGVDMRWGTSIPCLKDIEARWIVGADGSSSRVRRWAGLDRYVHNTHRFAYRHHYGLAPWTDLMEIHWGEDCQIYVTPTAANEVCIALISREQNLRLEKALEPLRPSTLRLRAFQSMTSRGRGRHYCGNCACMYRVARQCRSDRDDVSGLRGCDHGRRTLPRLQTSGPPGGGNGARRSVGVCAASSTARAPPHHDGAGHDVARYRSARSWHWHGNSLRRALGVRKAVAGSRRMKFLRLLTLFAAVTANAAEYTLPLTPRASKIEVGSVSDPTPLRGTRTTGARHDLLRSGYRQGER